MKNSASLLLLLLATAPAVAETPVLATSDVIPLLGHVVTDRENQEIGRIVDVLASPEGAPRAVVADVGGFLGMGARRIAITWTMLRFHHGPGGWAVSVDAPGAAVAAAPEYTADSKDIPVLSVP